jgi:tRNA threonylcarbamoyl adenosine modification protein YeaZ
MRILALDTALPAVCACVLDSDATEPLAIETLPMERGHAEALLPLIERVMVQVEGGFASVDRIAVTVGPGSFTGIRVAISAARGFGVALGIPVVGVSTLAAFAAPLVLGPRPAGQKPGSRHQPEVIVSAIDARHGQVYLQACSETGAILMAPTVLPLAEAVDKLPAGPLRITGSAAPLLAIAAWSCHRAAEVEGEIAATPILYVARLGMIADPEGAPPRPLYLKAPDVKPPSPFRFGFA